MTPNIASDPVPLRADERGALRVGDSRVPLDTLVEEYESGADPESIVHAYPSLRLADVYAVIAYYLRRQDEVNDYLRTRRAEAAALRQEIEKSQPDGAGLREKLLARQGREGNGHAPAGG